MKAVKYSVVALAFCLSLAACGTRGENRGASTPIDSTNVKGTAPATYGGNDPANDGKDSNRTNIDDTGTKANNIHNAGTR